MEETKSAKAWVIVPEKQHPGSFGFDCGQLVEGPPSRLVPDNSLRVRCGDGDWIFDKQFIFTDPQLAIERINLLRAKRLAYLEAELARVRAIDAEALVKAAK